MVITKNSLHVELPSSNATSPETEFRRYWPLSKHGFVEALTFRKKMFGLYTESVAGTSNADPQYSPEGTRVKQKSVYVLI